MLNYWFEDYHRLVFQNYGSPTCVTTLKVALNMADLISIRYHSDSRLNGLQQAKMKKYIPDMSVP